MLKDCNLRLTLEARDTRSSVLQASRQLVDIKSPTIAILGAAQSVVTTSLAIPKGDIPQVLAISISKELDNRDVFPNFARTVPMNCVGAHALVRYLEYMGISHLGILYAKDPYGIDYFADIFTAAEQSNNVVVEGVPFESNDNIETAAQRLQKLGFRYHLLIISQLEGYKQLLQTLSRYGLIANSQYVWFVTDALQILMQPWFTLDSSYQYDRSNSGIGTPWNIHCCNGYTFESTIGMIIATSVSK